MKRSPLNTRMILLVVPLMLECIGCTTRNEPQTDPYKFYRVPFPPEIRAVLEKPDCFTLYSIEGEFGIVPEVTERSFHGYYIHGKTEIADAKQRKSLVDALDQGISKVTHGAATCFEPRHGISVIQGDTRFDLVICFECFHILVLDENGKLIFSTQTTKDPAAVFNDVLKAAGVQLATPPPDK